MEDPLLFVVGFIVTFVIGGITGIMVASAPLDLQAHDSYFVVGHLHYVLIGGVAFPFFAAAYYWLPKYTGKLLDERLGKLNFWLMLIGLNVAFMPMHFVGLMGIRGACTPTTPARGGISTTSSRRSAPSSSSVASSCSRSTSCTATSAAPPPATTRGAATR